MGRTKRRRVRRKRKIRNVFLDSDPSIVDLIRWMKIQGWENITSLRLSLFKNTGRGLTSPKSVAVNDTLIEIPHELMITYATLIDFFSENSILIFPNKLKIHDALSIFLVIEHHKECNSKWKPYIDSLPKQIPLLPWLASQEEISTLYDEVLRPILEDKRGSFEASWQRSKESINPFWKCECCNTPGDRVLTLNLFTWAYAMVNTRAVYVDPDIVVGLSRCSENNTSFTLSDDPCMALCPYLDMFNHSYKSATNAVLEKVNGSWIYKLIALTSSEKYKEIFISYGAHDNEKLLCEYGFFIPNNELDSLKISFEDLLRTLSFHHVNIDERQYKFLRKRELDKDLYVTMEGLSFNLKAALFVVKNGDVVDWCSNIFSENYSKKHLLSIHQLTRDLTQRKIEECKMNIFVLNKYYGESSEFFKNIVRYMKYRLTFMEKILCSVLEVSKTLK